MRTHYCGEISTHDIGKDIEIIGWLHKKRELGGLLFLLIRDISGIVQVIVEDRGNSLYKLAMSCGMEYILAIKGRVIRRESENPHMKTGKIEVIAEHIDVISKSLTPPFVIDERETALEDMRLRFRFLDLRRPNMARNIKIRSEFSKAIRDFLHKNRFLEIETPILIKSTPEGARDYVVPSRVQTGKFYALPQSPQLLKQLLMVSGFDRYYQLSKCFRDEDLRRDRQPEFTQIDLEMSFIEEDDIYSLIEAMFKESIGMVFNRDIKTPFIRMSYQYAMENYGTDKPDLRFDLKITGLNDIFSRTQFRVFEGVLKGNGRIGGLIFKTTKSYSRKEIGNLEAWLRDEYGIGGLAFIRVKDHKLDGGISRFLGENEQHSILRLCNFESGMIFIVADTNHDRCNRALGALRLKIADIEGLISDKGQLQFVWVNQFPLFEFDEDIQGIVPKHHIFSMPTQETIHYLNDNPLNVRGHIYDLVLNGIELGSGSIRIHDPNIQKQVFKILGFSDNEINNRFGFLINSFDYGAPPHGGIALGFDRILMLLLATDSIRDVIAFPKTTSGGCLLTGAPSDISPEQLRELKLRIEN